MTDFLDQMLSYTSTISDNIWGWGPQFLGGLPLMVLLLIGTGVVLTAMTGFVQVRRFRRATRLVMLGATRKDQSEKEKGDISPFQALMTALSATVGNGNIAGVATAIATGGPGAAFWMWVTALFGMATKYAEAVLGVKYRKVAEDGTMSGGPMYYCQDGIGGWFGRSLGIMFAICGGIAALIGTGNIFQSNSMAVAFNSQYAVPQWVTGAVISTLTGLVILGGIKRIGQVAERLVPSMIILYFFGATTVLVLNAVEIPSAIGLIFTSAFSPEAVFGGAIGISIQQSIRFGVARGILSNESGLGSAPIAHGAARTKDPIRQGTIAMMGTFIDTIIVCSLTALVIVVTGSYEESIFMRGEEVGLTSTALTSEAFNRSLPSIGGLQLGGLIVSLGSFLFGVSTLIGWSYYGQQCAEYLLGIRVVQGYRILFIVLLFLGSLPTGAHVQIVTNIGDIGNALMAFPNLIALLFLAGTVRRLTLESYNKPELGVS